MVNLNPGTLGAVLPSVREARRRFQASEQFPLRAYEEGRRDLVACRRAIQAAFPSHLHPAITAGTTAAMDGLIASLALSGPHTVLCSDHEHEGGVAGFEAHPAFTLVALPDPITPETVAAAVRARHATILFLSQRTWTTGAALPLTDAFVAGRAVNPNIWCINDAAQALGVEALCDTADLVVGSGHKWLCGPRGSGILWANERALSLRTAWSGHAVDPEAPAAVFEQAGGQDFSRYSELREAISEHVAPGVGAARVAQALHARFPGAHFAHGDDWSPTPVCQGPVVVLRFPESHDPYPIYTRWNAAGLYTKCIKGRSPNGVLRNQLRLGFTGHLTPGDIAEAVDIIAQ